MDFKLLTVHKANYLLTKSWLTKINLIIKRKNGYLFLNMIQLLGTSKTNSATNEPIMQHNTFMI